jgi:hypothetical protein
MSEMISHDPFEHLKRKLWPKEGLGVKLAVWLPTIKSLESPHFLVCKCFVTYRWKAHNEGYNFALDLILIGGLYAKLWAIKIVGVPTVGISGLSLGSPGTKCHLNVGPVASHVVYYKREGGGFP